MRKLMVLLTALVALAACGSAGGNSAPSSRVGTWKAEQFVATITPNHIEIEMGTEDASGLYWKGTFPEGSDHVTSVADKAALDASLLGSQDNEKVFTLSGSTISFRMTILGTTRTVHLKKV